jgi:hypothetical protein
MPILTADVPNAIHAVLVTIGEDRGESLDETLQCLFRAVENERTLEDLLEALGDDWVKPWRERRQRELAARAAAAAAAQEKEQEKARAKEEARRTEERRQRIAIIDDAVLHKSKRMLGYEGVLRQGKGFRADLGPTGAAETIQVFETPIEAAWHRYLWFARNNLCYGEAVPILREAGRLMGERATEEEILSYAIGLYPNIDKDLRQGTFPGQFPLIGGSRFEQEDGKRSAKEWDDLEEKWTTAEDRRRFPVEDVREFEELAATLAEQTLDGKLHRRRKRGRPSKENVLPEVVVVSREAQAEIREEAERVVLREQVALAEAAESPYPEWVNNRAFQLDVPIRRELVPKPVLSPAQLEAKVQRDAEGDEIPADWPTDFAALCDRRQAEVDRCNAARAKYPRWLDLAMLENVEVEFLPRRVMEVVAKPMKPLAPEPAPPPELVWTEAALAERAKWELYRSLQGFWDPPGVDPSAGEVVSGITLGPSEDGDRNYYTCGLPGGEQLRLEAEGWLIRKVWDIPGRTNFEKWEITYAANKVRRERRAQVEARREQEKAERAARGVQRSAEVVERRERERAERVADAASRRAYAEAQREREREERAAARAAERERELEERRALAREAQEAAIERERLREEKRLAVVAAEAAVVELRAKKRLELAEAEAARKAAARAERDARLAQSRLERQALEEARARRRDARAARRAKDGPSPWLLAKAAATAATRSEDQRLGGHDDVRHVDEGDVVAADGLADRLVDVVRDDV